MGLILLALPLAVLEIGLRVAGIGGSLIYVEDPNCGYRPAPDQQFATMGHPIQILTNGFRGPPATNAVLIVGDSVTYGTAYLPDTATFPALLGAANAGVNGWGLQNMAGFLRHEDLRGYRTVVWAVAECDMLRPFMHLRGGLISTNRRMWLRLEYLWRFIWYGFVRPPPALQPASYETNWQAVVDTARDLESRGVGLLVVFIPSRETSLGRTTVEGPYFQRMIADAATSGVPHVVAAATGDPQVLFRDQAHLTPAGSRWLADLIGARLDAAPR